MINIKTIAEELSIPEDKLIKESLKTFIEKRLIEIKSEIFRITQKYNVSGIEELNKLAEEGKVSEEEAYEDYFLLDNLEAEKEKLEKILRLLND